MKKRVLSAIVLLVVVFTCIFLSEQSRVLFFAAAAIVCAYEYSRALETKGVYCCAWVMYVYAAAQAALAIFHADTNAYYVAFTIAVFLALFSGILHSKVSGEGAIYTLAGIAYPCFLFGILMKISVCDIWLETLALGALSTWICDSFALFGGMAFGKHKIAPLVSPKKTVEGCICGALGAAASGILFHYILFPAVPVWVCVITTLVASTLGQIGDLAESLLKRMIGVKDFSNLIPGHGGMFDRSDSLLFAIPTAYICLYVFGIGV